MIPSELISRLRGSSHCVIMTGAGISAESGVPTFRDAQTGLWAKYEPTELATPRAFRANPKLVWDWYQWRRNLVLNVEPNSGHHAIAELSRVLPQVTLVTQNVDGLHQRAGSSEVIELHGNILRAKCFEQHHLASTYPPDSETHPVCDQCGSLMRPDVVWFEESLPATALEAAAAAVGECDFFFSIGTSSVVFPAASFGFEASSGGATVVEINPSPTPLTDRADFVLDRPSGEVLPEIVAALLSI